MGENPPAGARDTGDAGSVPGLVVSLGGAHGNPFRCSCQESPMDRGTWQAMVHGVASSQTCLSDSAHTYTSLR